MQWNQSIFSTQGIKRKPKKKVFQLTIKVSNEEKGLKAQLGLLKVDKIKVGL